jgi:uncharacterized protein (TIGR00255 family)
MKQAIQPLASMTGYARASGVARGVGYSCEVKSVNARGLDIRMRLAPGLDILEAELRRRIGKAISRGSVTMTVTLEREGTGGEVVINQQALGAVLDALDKLAGRIEADRPTLDGILALKGVLEQRESPLGPDAEEALHTAILETVDFCIDDLVQSRRLEGDRLTGVLVERVSEIETLTAQAEAHPSRHRETILQRLRQQVSDLVASGSALSEDRLAQEALLLATKADIREELDRLTAHVGTARQLIANGGPVGRKLDFLAQEFNREANTLCSKSNAVELTTIGLDLKTAIDQLREQVQNIE